MSEVNIVYVDEDLEDLIPGFMENRVSDVAKIKELLSTGDMSEIQRIGHSMKGSGGGYGFEEITVIGGKIEDAAKRVHASELSQLSDDLSNYLSSVKIVYQEEE